jgi:hypothetical protein
MNVQFCSDHAEKKGAAPSIPSCNSGVSAWFSLAFVGTSMGDWLVRHVTIFGIHGQNWMLITFGIIVIWIALSWWSVGGLFHIKPSPRCRLLADSVEKVLFG